MRICIYGAASESISDEYKTHVYNLCKNLAERGHSLVFGAGDGGLMGAAARGFHDAGAHVMGVAPTFFKDTIIEKLYEDSDVIVYTESMGVRKSVMEANADAFLVVPGGIGTYDEFFETLTLKQLNQIHVPIALFNIMHFYTPVDMLLLNAMREKVLRSDTKSLCKSFTEYEQDKLIEYLENPAEHDMERTVDNTYGM